MIIRKQVDLMMRGTTIVLVVEIQPRLRYGTIDEGERIEGLK